MNSYNNDSSSTETKITNGDNMAGEIIKQVVIGLTLIGMGCGWKAFFLFLNFGKIGSIVGYGLIVMGILNPVLAVVMEIGGYLKGKCPYCGYEVTAPKDSPGEDCPSCKQRILIREQRFVRLE